MLSVKWISHRKLDENRKLLAIHTKTYGKFSAFYREHSQMTCVAIIYYAVIQLHRTYFQERIQDESDETKERLNRLEYRECNAQMTQLMNNKVDVVVVGAVASAFAAAVASAAAVGFKPSKWIEQRPYMKKCWSQDWINYMLKFGQEALVPSCCFAAKHPNA